MHKLLSRKKIVDKDAINSNQHTEQQYLNKFGFSVFHSNISLRKQVLQYLNKNILHKMIDGDIL